MAMVANDPTAAKRLGIPQSVGKDFTEADKGRKFGLGGRPDLAKINKPKTDHGKQALFKEGGMAKHDDLAEDKKLIKKAFGMHDKQEHLGKKTDLSKLKGGGMAKDKEPRMASKGEHAIQKRSKRGAEEITMCGGGKVKKMAFGGLPTQAAPQASVGMANRPAMPAQSNAGGAMTGLDRAAAMSGRAFSKGGSASKRADGIASKGKTRGKIC